ncbi:hypothetical protein QBC34DRAFT_467489 [Podospora aff. communis PSN243]|uniref:Allergen n=1 Tax=Podospora aff. communis PSN243 TaxID=3040156 RepID=A0AAV9GGU4_9PEZI|nr:hypothetical protein QBC34DRAFT_467489 [Podospora aff. communis PSN243]
MPMDKTKKALGDMMSKAGHHDTTVTEETAPAIEQKTIKPTQHEEISTAVEQEVHQDHYHRTIQPVAASETLPEQHKHRVAGTVHREFDHRDSGSTEQALRAEAGKLRDTKTVEETTKTQSRAPTVQGEHVHHHVHETIQPVIQKEVIQPEVIHTAVPVHEVHHNAARIHPTSTKEAMTAEEFKKAGGSLSGSTTVRTNQFEGCPQGKGVHDTATSSTTSGMSSSGISSSNKTSGMSSTGTTGISSTGTTGLGSSTSTSTSEKKPSLIDRLNPYKDADNDGKKGFLS